jgi:DNA/RNA-binding domain of Phe-tRNA-synthetase-like protein
VSELDLRAGVVAPELRAEFDRLGLVWVDAPVSPGRSPPSARRRLRALSGRVRGPQALLGRQQPVPHAYRVFYRHIGLDPDVHRPPAGAALQERLVAGEFRSRDRVTDACLVALLETHVPVWALDAARVQGALALRLSAAGELVGRGRSAVPIAAGRIVVADGAGALAAVFADPGPDLAVGRSTRCARLFCVRVPGVPDIHVEEALWTCRELLDAAR